MGYHPVVICKRKYKWQSDDTPFGS